MTWTQDPDIAITRWLEGEAPIHAPADLLDTSRALVLGTSQRRAPMRWPMAPGMRNVVRFALAAAALVAALAVGIGIGAGIDRPTDGPGLTVPSTSHGPSASPQATPDPTAKVPIRGWPGPRVGPAGRYTFGLFGERWMHNVSGEHSVEMWFKGSPVSGPLPTGEPVTIAGFDGTLSDRPPEIEGVEGRLIDYVVDMEDRRVRITIVVGADTSDADIAMARAVVESILREPWPEGNGYRLTFTLGDGWDSG